MKYLSELLKVTKTFIRASWFFIPLVMLSACQLSLIDHKTAAEHHFTNKSQIAINNEQWQQAKHLTEAWLLISNSAAAQEQLQQITSNQEQIFQLLQQQLKQKNTDKIQLLRQLLTIQPDNVPLYNQLKLLVAQQESAQLKDKHRERKKKWQQQFNALAKTQSIKAKKLATSKINKVSKPNRLTKQTIKKNKISNNKPKKHDWPKKFALLVKQDQLANAANLLIAQMNNPISTKQQLIEQKRTRLADLLYRKGQKVFASSINEAIRLWQLCLELDGQYQKAKIKLLMAYKVRKNLNEIK